MYRGGVFGYGNGNDFIEPPLVKRTMHYGLGGFRCVAFSPRRPNERITKLKQIGTRKRLQPAPAYEFLFAAVNDGEHTETSVFEIAHHPMKLFSGFFFRSNLSDEVHDFGIGKECCDVGEVIYLKRA